MSDDVSQFLQQVAQLNDRRIEEDEARTRELEEKILQEKRERQARRAERARSISPQKSSPASTPPPSSHRTQTQVSDDLKLSYSPVREKPPSPRSHVSAGPDAMNLSTSPTKENDSPFDGGPKRSSVVSPSGARPLSWQRRPNSQASDRPKSRPLSVVAAENAAARAGPASPEPSSATEQALSKEQIAQALSSKDPAWFRQTADRGLGSAAYRKSQVEDEDRLDMSSVRGQLPSMSRESEETGIRQAPSKFGSPLPMTSAQKLDPPSSDGAGDSDFGLERSYTMSSGSGRASPSRPLSPTKGMGGFVQSAMMKRSDSVKRWSVTAVPGLARADSVSSNRNGYDRTASPQPASRPTSMIRDGSATPSSRPTSRGATEEKKADMDATPKAAVADPAPETKLLSLSTKDDEDSVTPPSSPSKTMDPRRWSPTKASWLEAALNKPESPKPKPTPPPSNQPAWMVELNKAKAQKTGPSGAEAGRTGSVSHKHAVSIGGLMRSSPMGVGAKPVPAGLGGIYSPPTSTSRPGTSSSFRGSSSRSTTRSDTGDAGSPADDGEESSPTSRQKPETPPKKDFRTNLKPRQGLPDASKKDANEFQNVFGNLKRTETKNFVPPDTLKDNILRGKAALNITGGPKPSVRRDDFKDAILKKKAEFKQAQAEGKGVVRAANPSTIGEKPVPEGLARRAEMGRSAQAAREDFGSTTTSPVKSVTEKKLPGKVGGSLADRFNPGLAGLLARGPPPMASGVGNDAESKGPANDGDVGEPVAAGPQLTHMTKGRARGPRRKAPNTAPADIDKDPAAPAGSESTKLPSLEPLKTTEGGRAEYQAAPSSPKSRQAQAEANALFKSHPRPVQIEDVKDEEGPASTSVVQSIGSQVAAQAALKNRTSSPVRRAEDTIEKPPSQPSSPKKLDLKRRSAFLDGANLPNPQSEPVKRSSSPTSPKKSDLASDRVDSDPVISVRNATGIFGGAAATAMSSPPKEVKAPFDGPPLQQDRPNSPSKRFSRPRPITPGPASPALTASPMRSPTKQTMEVSALLEEFFGNKKPKRNYRTDTAEILTNRPQNCPRVKSMGAQLFRFSGDGKKVPVPSHHERVLFEREMYICPHNFTNQAGRNVSEVYFWVGDEVPVSAVEDADIFVNKEAKSLGGKLVRLRQGKETPEFIEALGGILITRRGSSNKYDSLAANMLCGRRFLGQVAFDEVDFAPASLCSGFPYLITQQGRCYLWKGKGSDVDELSCARLVGMDLTLTGELTEIEDGAEPAGFWDVFDGGSKLHSADHWRLKPSYDKYCGRLFCSDAASAKQIIEISPFSQADLQPTKIYILDAFFEMYIIVGYKAQSQYPAFRNALDFAQEYAILASGMEDRPFVPISTVVLEGIPRDLKSVFRKWRDGLSPTIMNSTAGLRRGRSLRIVTLTHALQALSE